MRKITKESARAYSNNNMYKKDNTKVIGSCFYLHDNLIAEKTKDTLYIYDGGWQSNTTKERLNGILYYLGLGHVFQKDFAWYYMDTDRKVIDFNNAMSFKL